MHKPIVDRNNVEFQAPELKELVSIGIKLVHKVFGLMDCNPELSNNFHAIEAEKLAKEWSKVFDKEIIEYVLTREVK